MTFLGVVIVTSFVDFYWYQGESIAKYMEPIIYLLGALTLFWWSKKHSEENSIDASNRTHFFSAILPIIGVPIYFFRYFGLKKGGEKFLLSIGYLIVAFLLYSETWGLLT